jgi:ABC-2 type transport system ATP-binding protein
MQPDKPLLHVRNLSVHFGELRAVDDVSLSLCPGDLLGLIGPNGAGKTTLLRAIVGLVARQSGRVEVLDTPIDPNHPAALARVGFTPDEPRVYEEMTVRDFLRFIARGYELRGSEIDEKIGFWLEQVWLSEKADQKIKSLSRGMRQRIGIARALLPDPLVVLLDEPAAGLDPAGRVQFRQLLNALRSQGKALIVSSHILADMGEYCSHIAIMGHGRLLRLGTVQQIAAGLDGDLVEYAVELSRPVPRIEEELAEIDGLHFVRCDGTNMVVRYPPGRDAATTLLKSLVQRGLPVSSFSAVGANLEAAYLREGIRQVD